MALRLSNCPAGPDVDIWLRPQTAAESATDSVAAFLQQCSVRKQETDQERAQLQGCIAELHANAAEAKDRALKKLAQVSRMLTKCICCWTLDFDCIYSLLLPLILSATYH